MNVPQSGTKHQGPSIYNYSCSCATLVTALCARLMGQFACQINTTQNEKLPSQLYAQLRTLS